MPARWTLAKALALAVCLAAPLMVLSQGTSGQATFRLKVPASASVIVNGSATKSTGTDRSYITAPIEAGKSATYVVEVIFTDAKGEQRKQTVNIPLKPGDDVTVDLSGGAGAAPMPSKKEEPKKVEPPVIKKEEPKKVEPPKKEEPKKVEPPVKKEEPKKVEPPVKKEEPKKVETPKKVEPPVKKEEPKKTSAAKERKFHFSYGGTIKNLPVDKEASVWIPVAVDTANQKVSIVGTVLGKGLKPEMGSESQYGNKLMHFKAKPEKDGTLDYMILYEVARKEVKTDAKTAAPATEDKKQIDRFLKPDAKVPTTGKPLELIKDKKLPTDQMAAGKVLYDVVNSHMKYSKEGKGWGQGDSVWACDSKFGNCSDFHSLFISMARGNKIPAKFEMGFPIPPKRGEGVVGGYHCWAWFMPDGKGWVPVDISEANRNPEMKEYYFGNLTEDRVVFTTGRDLQLTPPQKGPAVNFLIYPYVEVEGKAHGNENLQNQFTYKDVN